MNFSDLTDQQAEEPMRRAAVVAHSLSSADQDWLFSKMTPTELVQLKSLMAELVQLGVPSDRRLLEQALENAKAEGTVPPIKDPVYQPSKEESDLDFFENLSPIEGDALATALRQEPALLIARFLKIRSWPWKQTVLDGLHVPLRQQVDDLLASPSHAVVSGAVLESALLRAMRLRCEPSVVVAPPDQTAPRRTRSGGSTLVKTWLQRWGSRDRGLQA